MWWQAIQGAARYARCSRAGVDDRWSRISRCAGCEAATIRHVPAALSPTGERLAVWFCGEPLKKTDSTCGCLVMAQGAGGGVLEVTVDGVRVHPIGKPLCSAEACPRGYWPATSRGKGLGCGGCRKTE